MQTPADTMPQDTCRTAAGLSQFLGHKTAGTEHSISAGDHCGKVEKRTCQCQRSHRCRPHTPRHPRVEPQRQTLQKKLYHGHLNGIPNYTAFSHLYASFKATPHKACA